MEKPATGNNQPDAPGNCQRCLHQRIAVFSTCSRTLPLQTQPESHKSDVATD